MKFLTENECYVHGIDRLPDPDRREREQVSDPDRAAAVRCRLAFPSTQGTSVNYARQDAAKRNELIRKKPQWRDMDSIAAWHGRPE